MSIHQRGQELLGMQIHSGDSFTYNSRSCNNLTRRGTFVRFQAAPIDDILIVFNERGRERSYFLDEISNLCFANRKINMPQKRTRQQVCFNALDRRLSSLYEYLMDNFSWLGENEKEIQSRFDDLSKVMNKLEQSLNKSS